MIRTAIVLVTWIICSLAQAADLSGVPRIVDGDTLAIGSTKIRLEGIDAPETDQVCLNAGSVRWTCGIDARDAITAHVAGQEITCTPHGTDVYRRTLATCYLAGEDLNGWLVQQGWALAYVKYSSAYLSIEEEARAAKRGLWAGAFIAPWDWRHRNRQTVILGATAVPITAQAELLAPNGAAQAPSLDCIIKGNVNRAGERIYFRPGQLDYARVDMTKSGKRWFCTEDEAKTAGWRPAAR